jgi:hypothetical protein
VKFTLYRMDILRYENCNDKLCGAPTRKLPHLRLTLTYSDWVGVFISDTSETLKIKLNL